MSKRTLIALSASLAMFALTATHTVAQTPGLMSLPKEPTSVYAVTTKHVLIRFDPAEPAAVLDRKALEGLPDGEQLRGIDYRVQHGVLYALGASGQLYTLDTQSAALTKVGDGKLPIELPEGPLGFDFNPAADRIRVVAGDGLNLRLHPDTGAAVDFNDSREGFQSDRALTFGFGDRHSGRSPRIVAAAYTYNADDDKITSNYAIDIAEGVLVLQGSREGSEPPVSPNLGVLTTVGELGTGPLADASFDISDVSGTALAALRIEGSDKTELYRVNLDIGRAFVIGQIGDGEPLIGLAIEP